MLSRPKPALHPPAHGKLFPSFQTNVRTAMRWNTVDIQAALAEADAADEDEDAVRQTLSQPRALLSCRRWRLLNAPVPPFPSPPLPPSRATTTPFMTTSALALATSLSRLSLALRRAKSQPPSRPSTTMFSTWRSDWTFATTHSSKGP